MEDNSRGRIKILIIYHDHSSYDDGLSRMVDDEIFTPIYVGKQDVSENRGATQYSLSDKVGDNISEKNASYNELTAVYWAWKNYEYLGNPEYIGMMHYRRTFIFDEYAEGAVVVNDNTAEDYWDLVRSAEGAVKTIIAKYDMVCPKPLYRHTVYEHFKSNHKVEDLEMAIDIIHKKYPEYRNSLEKYLNGDNAFFYNMFIMKKELFFKYCEWIFDILSEFEKRVDITNKRLFISERLTGIFMQYTIDCGYRTGYLATSFWEVRHTIPVLMSTDDRYVVQTGIAISSILLNAKKNTAYRFYIMVPPELSEESRQLLSRLKQIYKELVLEFIDMGQAFFSATIQKNSHITRPTYYRLMAPDLFLQYKKMIYLDSDVIVRKDLSELYNNYVDDYLVAGVKAPAYHMYSKEHNEWYCKKIGIADLDQYINAGVLLMNLESMRRNNLVSKFISLSSNDNPSQDQDVINICCYGQIKILPLRFNNMLSKYAKKENELKNIFTEEELMCADRCPVIIHYCDKRKPWNTMECRYSKEWWKYAEISPYYKEVLELYPQSPDTEQNGRTRLKQIDNFRRRQINASPCKVSVILPVYNEEVYLSYCLESVRNQTLKDIEIICVNDGSTDHTGKILADYVKKDERIHVIEQENMGAGGSRNTGIRHAKGEFIAFMDADDYYPSNSVLEVLYITAKLYHKEIAGGSFCEDHEGIIRYEFRDELKQYVFQGRGMHKFSDYQFDYGYTRFIYSTRLINDNQIRFPMYRRFQDPPFFIEAMLKAGTFYAIPMRTYCYRWDKQKIKWDIEKVKDLVRGITDCLGLSKENRLSRLHLFSISHIDQHYYNRIVSVEHEDKELLSLLENANALVDTDLLEQEGIDCRNGYSLRAYLYFISR